MAELGETPDILHAHEWAAGLVPFFHKIVYRPAGLLRETATVFTFHNLAFQGLFWHSDMNLLGLGEEGWRYFTPSYLEFYGKLNFLKAGIVFADFISTVSGRYAREVLTPDFGCGLDGVLRERENDLVGILNGVDYDLWNPLFDEDITAKFGPQDLSGKKACKAALQKEMGLDADPGAPLVGMVSQLLVQKGIDLLNESAGEIIDLGAQVALLGNGPRVSENMFGDMAGKEPGRFAARFEYDPDLARRIIAGADFILMPSRFEPCGLDQMRALKYGTVPIVRATGGLDDTVVPCDKETARGNGFKFTEYTKEAFLAKVREALRLYKNKAAFAALVQRAMDCDFSWDRQAAEYVALYERAVSERSENP